ncbi:spermine oxidase [Schistocerca nitens]|uniref:spermine oxidase n=1 Tax=Schistocerca nitens TaxID=7011 RepID=UPI0021187217|nr:spermine oxidase [Schistocerca nitens]XP_049811900.1 spermine oxidase [Schistocerca nitens]
MISTKAVIIGAGAAGIAAACRLLERGMNDFVVLEAEDRIGGRVHSVDFCGNIVDLGAHWVHGEKGNVVFALLKDLNILQMSVTSITEDNVMFVDSSGKPVAPEKLAKIYGIISEIEQNSTSGLKNFWGSVGDYFTREFQRQITQPGLISAEDLPLAYSVLEWYSKFEKSIDGSDNWFQTSGKGLTEYWECEGNQLWAWKHGGYGNILDVLMKKYPNPHQELPLKERLQLSKEVTKIEWDSLPNEMRGKVIVSCLDGSQYIADHVIVTVSLGVLKAQAKAMFSPPLPAYKMNAIKGLSIGTVNKVYMKFSHQWWPEDCSGFGFLWNAEDKAGSETSGGDEQNWLKEVFMFNTVDNHPLCLCGWIVGPEARKMELMSDTEVCDSLMSLLKHFLGKHFKVPYPEKILRSSWTANPHFRGSYSFRSLDTERYGTNAASLAKPISNTGGNQVLLFAGEATHDHYYSTVHGAIETGWREADRILNEARLFKKSSL